MKKYFDKCLLVVSNTGVLSQKFVPFPVICLHSTENYPAGTVLFVEEVWFEGRNLYYVIYNNAYEHNDFHLK